MTNMDTLAFHFKTEPEIIERHIDPSVIEKVFDTNAKFLECLSSVTRSSIGKNVNFSPLTISTMTITGKFEHDQIELPIVRIRDALEEHTLEDGLYIGGQVKVSKTKKVLDVRKFNHQVSFMFEKKSVKLFYNGTIHATGFATIIEFVHISLLIAEFIEKTVGIRVKLADFTTNLINAGTIVQRGSFPLSFSPHCVYVNARQSGMNAFFDPERHPAVKLLLFEDSKKISTAFVFGTGSIVIFGAKNVEHISRMFDVIANFLSDIQHFGTTTSLRKTTVKKDFSISHGYLSNSYTLCVSP